MCVFLLSLIKKPIQDVGFRRQFELFFIDVIDVSKFSTLIQKMNPKTIITLPWPPKELNPNARMHHQALARVKKAYRAVCAAQAMEQGMEAMKAPVAASGGSTGTKAHVSLTFYPPTKARRDLDNCLASMKSGLDGVADALGVDDSQWTLTLAMADTVGGFVRVEVAA